MAVVLPMTAPLFMNGKAYCPTCRVGEQELVILTYINENGVDIYECPLRQSECAEQYTTERIQEWP